MLLTFSTCQAAEIDIKRKETMQHGGPRMPSITHVTANYENDKVTLYISCYTGSVQANVSDSYGRLLGTVSSYISRNGTITMVVNCVSAEIYYLSISLDNASYIGIFNG